LPGVPAPPRWMAGYTVALTENNSASSSVVCCSSVSRNRLGERAKWFSRSARRSITVGMAFSTRVLPADPDAVSPGGGAEIRHLLTSPYGDLTHAVCRAGEEARSTTCLNSTSSTSSSQARVRSGERQTIGRRRRPPANPLRFRPPTAQPHSARRPDPSTRAPSPDLYEPPLAHRRQPHLSAQSGNFPRATRSGRESDLAGRQWTVVTVGTRLRTPQSENSASR
jgi:hypothetical protein